MKRLASIIKQGGALAGVQLNHAGAKAEMSDIDKLGTTMYFDYLDQKTLSIITVEQLKDIEDKFVASAHRAKEAGFDFVEIHGAHGYLLSALINPKINDVIKSDDILVRAETLINIVKRVKEEVGIPMGVRLSVSDVVKGGLEPADFEPLIKAIDSYVEYYNISTGETIAKVNGGETIAYFGGNKIFRITPAKEIKKFTNKPIFIASNMSTREDVEYALSNGIDVALIGRESIFNPNVVVNTFLDPEEMGDEDYH